MNIFRQKFPCAVSWKSRLLTALLFGVFIIAFLLAFKPFELDTLPTGRLVFFCSVYGFTTFACIVFVGFIIPKAFPSFYNEETWTTGKQIIVIIGAIILIGSVNYLISPLMTGADLSLGKFLWYQGITVLGGILPVTIYILIRQNSLLMKFEKQASILEKKLQEKLDQDKKQEAPPTGEEKKNELTVIELRGDYQGEKLMLLPEELYLIAAANNYVKVYFFKNEKVSYSI